MHAAYGLAANPVMATLLAYPASAALLDTVRQSADAALSCPTAAQARWLSSPQFACSHVDGVFVARAVGAHVDQVRAVMENVWRRLRPQVIGRDAVAPRIWST
jgi:urease accessory protein